VDVVNDKSINNQSKTALAAKGIFPLILLAIFLVIFLRVGPVGVFRVGFPPVEELTFERVAFPSSGLVKIHLINGGPESVTIAQAMIDEAYWGHTVTPSRKIGRLDKAVVDIPYPWVQGEPIEISLLSSTGVTFTYQVAVATQSPEINSRYVMTFAMLGIYVGVIPVFLGLLWLPFLSGISKRWLDFFMSLTVGLLIFLGVDALEGALKLTDQVAPAFQGVGLVLLGVAGIPILINSLSHILQEQYTTGPLWLSLLIALGIGLHNLGEGLAVGSAYAVGEVALGTSLVLGFLLHNTTEGLGIIAPLAHSRPKLKTLIVLGMIAGLPTILGAWIGGFSYSPRASVLFLAIGAGAMIQVIWVMTRSLMAENKFGISSPLNAVGLVTGLIIMYATGLFIAI
jgi:ZIP family zinc transporter